MLALLVLALLCSSVLSQTNDVSCEFQYTHEPTAPPSNVNCSLLQQNVELQCGSSNYSETTIALQWYRSTDVSDAGNATGVTSRGVANLDSVYTVRESHQQIPIISRLIILDLDVLQFGYYWCVVTANNTIQPTPSRVLYIGVPCSSAKQDCTDMKLWNSSDSGRCPQNSSPAVDIVAAHQCESNPTPNPDTTETTAVEATEPSNTAEANTTQQASTVSTSDTQPQDTTPPPTSAAPTIPPSASSTTWLIVGISVAVILALIASTIALIMCFQFRRIRAKGPLSIPQQNTTNASTINGRYIASPDTKSDLLDQEHEYAEVTAQYRDRGIRNPTFGQPPSPHDSKPRGYENVNNVESIELHAVNTPHNYELVTREQSENYSHLQHSSSSTSSSGSEKGNSSPVTRSLTATRLPLPKPPTKSAPPPASQAVFDNPDYSEASEIASKLGKRSEGSHKMFANPDFSDADEIASKLAKRGPAPLPTDGALEDYYEKPVEFASKKGFVALEGEKRPPLCLDSKGKADATHAYTPIELNKQPRPNNNYSHAIRSLEDSYTSERGHVYQVLEDSLKTKSGDNFTKDTNGPPGMDQPVYHILETSPTKSEPEGPVYHVLEGSQTPPTEQVEAADVGRT